MTTNDVNLQVINSMTQAQMQSLKDANGKIPSLANQIIMTDEEDVNLSQLRAKVLWINPSPTSSFPAKTITFENNDGFDYFLIISRYNINIDSYVSHFGEVGKGIHITDVRAKSGSHFAMYERSASNITQTSVTFSEADEQYSDGSFVVSNSYLVPYQIIGLKKSPSMIYTGKELFAGKGINIDNGVISSNLEMDLLWENGSPTSYFGGQTITVANLSNYNTICVLYKSINASGVLSIGYSFGKNEINNGINLIFVEDQIAGRFVIVKSSTTVEFGDCYQGISETHNGKCIPIALYGLNIKIKE